MADTNSVILTLGYTNTDFTRQLKIDNVEIEFPDDFTIVGESSVAMRAMEIHIPATNKFKAATLYQYFYLCDDDVEAI